MGATTSIEWADATWNPWRGCDKVSPGCANCYMFRDQKRYGRDPSIVTRAAKGTFQAPLSARFAGTEQEVKRRHTPPDDRRLRVFTCSWSDWFHEDADPWREEAWEIVRSRPEYDFLILTKRPERMAEHMPPDWGSSGWPNVWLGVSVENRAHVGRVDLLREVPAAVRFVSAEPLLGPLVPTIATNPQQRRLYRGMERVQWADGKWRPALSLSGVDWLIVGGESGGPVARRLVDADGEPIPERADWVRDLRRECLACECRITPPSEGSHLEGCPRRDPTAFFLKQWGGARPGGSALLDGREWHQFPKRESQTTLTRGEA